MATSDSSEIEALNVTGEGGLHSDPAEDPQSQNPSRIEKGDVARISGKPGERPFTGDVGQLLRGAYRQTVDETIPDDLMDLLNKLE